MREALSLLAGAARRDPAVEAWFAVADPLRALAAPWFAALRGQGDDVRELLQDGNPTACVGDAAFAYVAAYSRHAAIGFFHGAALADPAGLEGTGRRMRHVKLRWASATEPAALRGLIGAAYADIRSRL